MSMATLKLCDLCDTPLEGQMKGETRREKRYNGLVVEIGYSLNGWGSRKDHVKFSGEVCIPCYEAVMREVTAVQRALANRRSPKHKPDAQASPLRLTR